MSEVFDLEAVEYDVAFTNSPIGKYQRNQVWHQLKKTIANNKIKAVFEVNCGTGHDAVFLNSLNCQVIATDISPEMIEIANAKISPTKKLSLHFHTMDARDIGSVYPESPQDVIFSNFGGLNCLNPTELKDFIFNSYNSIKPKGRLVLVLISKKCLWEKFYFNIKGNKARRNTSEAVEANLGNETFPIWYYSKKEIQQMASGKFQIVDSKPIGFFIPPSYLNKAFMKRKWVLKVLSGVDWLLKEFGFLGDYADHIYIEMKKI